MTQFPFDSRSCAGAAGAPIFFGPLNRLVRFGLVGILATLFYFLMVNAIVLGFGIAPVEASIYAYLTSLGCSYLMQSRFTFGIRDDSLKQGLRFLATSLAGLAISFGAMSFSINVLGLPYFVGAVAICVLIPLINFFVFQHWVFARRPVAGAKARPDTDRM